MKTLYETTKANLFIIFGVIYGIGGKMLSQDLKELEINNIIERNVLDTRPINVIYKLTPYGRTLQPIVEQLKDWGICHRKKIKDN